MPNILLNSNKIGGIKMLSQKVLDYVDDVMSRITASEEYKMKLENKLIRHILRASGRTSIDDVLNKLGSPNELADEISRKSTMEMSKESDSSLMEVCNENSKSQKMAERSSREVEKVQNYEKHMPGYTGEYMREESNVNIKLLHIPLIQISSGVERIRLPIVGECYID